MVASLVGVFIPRLVSTEVSSATESDPLLSLSALVNAALSAARVYSSEATCGPGSDVL